VPEQPADAAAATKPASYRIRIAQPLIDDDDRRAVLDALSSGQLAQGPRVATFEEAFARACDVPHAVAVSSGTAALHLALAVLGCGDGEVIVPAFSFAATANAVLQAKARPVFVDVRDDDFGIDPATIAAAVTSQTRAVIAVHLYGQICDIDDIAEICEAHGLALVEDAAQAVGASKDGRPPGSWGTGCFSFYATKNLTTGEGGMITTSDASVADGARLLRSQGERERYVTQALGYNYRMTEMEAALGASQLAKLDARNDVRSAHAARLCGLLAANRDVVVPRDLPGRRHAWHQYTVRVPAGAAARDDLRATLAARGIESAVFYPTPIHRQPLYTRLGYGDARLPVAERLAGEVLSLPVHPALSDADIDEVAAAVNAWQC
jgi:dTDP-4-amino-4,6-dideoxygalactose transaminase